MTIIMTLSQLLCLRSVLSVFIFSFSPLSEARMCPDSQKTHNKALWFSRAIGHSHAWKWITIQVGISIHWVERQSRSILDFRFSICSPTFVWLLCCRTVVLKPKMYSNNTGTPIWNDMSGTLHKSICVALAVIPNHFQFNDSQFDRHYKLQTPI